MKDKNHFYQFFELSNVILLHKIKNLIKSLISLHFQ